MPHSLDKAFNNFRENQTSNSPRWIFMMPQSYLAMISLGPRIPLLLLPVASNQQPHVLRCQTRANPTTTVVPNQQCYTITILQQFSATSSSDSCSTLFVTSCSVRPPFGSSQCSSPPLDIVDASIPPKSLVYRRFQYNCKNVNKKSVQYWCKHHRGKQYCAGNVRFDKNKISGIAGWGTPIFNSTEHTHSCCYHNGYFHW